MRITIEQDEQAFDTAAAWRIISQMLKKPDAVIGLSTGQTTGGMHRVVSDIYRQYPFDVSKVTIFNVDELTNLDRSYPGSCYTMIYEQLVKPLNIPEDHFIMPPTMSDDFERECRIFDQRLAERGGVDLQMLGIGFNGHIGINQPGTPFESTTWVSPMDPIFEARVRRETGVGPDYPLGGLTLGIKNIMHARHLVLVAKGAHKADIIEQALFGPVNTDMPASVVQLHPNCEVLLDAAAASKIIDRLKA
ncbi:6-phosphogluconolactonase [Paenibacillus physcomitrellae]|uniref:Glucosamine-6-phosphate deaminase n=1 Tax=Paenibacillus physcomitrellae TaxID=1619311 RepID=A0ABQ1G426_9BACL|nr:glucosamine-6-phosphate deaminase [Paenibacillus physcomitrellae]GGA37118.1 glucosamine-6-phosphate deaminase [Paenibacillus physcomitrellae]